MLKILLKIKEWIGWRIARLDWGQIESIGFWPADLDENKKIVQSMEQPWASIRYSERMFPVSDEVLYAVSGRMDASQIWFYLSNQLCLWKCADPIEDITFRAIVYRGCKFTSLHLNKSNRLNTHDDYFCKIIVSDKQWFA